MVDNDQFIKRIKIILHWNFHALRAAMNRGIHPDSLAVDFLFRERAALKRRLRELQNGV